MTENYCIRILDDDEDVLTSLSIVLEGRGWKTRAYSEAQQFIDFDPIYEPGCLLLDIQMPGLDGIEVQKILNERNRFMPIIFMTAYANVDLAVHTMKFGAYDFFQKPVDIDKLCQRIKEVRIISTLNKIRIANETELAVILSSLSQRERELFSILYRSNISNRDIGELLNLSERTIEGHRQSLYRKLNVHSFEELNRLFLLSKSSPKLKELFEQILLPI